jgi:integrase
VALDNEKLEINPASRIKRKAEHNDRIRFLSEKEEKRLTDTIREKWPHYLPAFQFSLHTGMRASEQWGLVWSDINKDARFLTLHKTKPGKTRHIPLNDVAMAALDAVPGRHHPDTPVFLNTEGNALRSARDWFEPAVEDAEVRGYTWHCNRHTFASRLVMAGVDIRTVASLMGHATIQMTMRYSHLAPEHNREAVNRLVLGNGVVTKSATGHSNKKRAETRRGDKFK